MRDDEREMSRSNPDELHISRAPTDSKRERQKQWRGTGHIIDFAKHYTGGRDGWRMR
jgi:hypothetical protein